MKKARRLFVMTVLIGFVPFSAKGQGTMIGGAPGMFKVNEVVIHTPVFEDLKAASSCDVSVQQVSDAINAGFKDSSVPTIPAREMRPANANTVRIHYYTRVSSHIDLNLECVSWISVSAETRNNLTVPPITFPRSVTVVYWRDNTKASGGQFIHNRRVQEAVTKITQKFAQQFKLEQPNTLYK